MCSPAVVRPVARFALSALPTSSAQAPTEPSTQKRVAVATLVCDDSDVVALHMLLYSLVSVDHQVPFDIVVLLNERVSVSEAQRLERTLGQQSDSRLVHFARHRPIAHTCTVERLYLFGMVAYTRVLFVPVHSLVLKPLDSWLAAQTDESAAAPTPTLPHVLLSDLLLVEPSERGFEHMLQQARGGIAVHVHGTLGTARRMNVHGTRLMKVWCVLAVHVSVRGQCMGGEEPVPEMVHNGGVVDVVGRCGFVCGVWRVASRVVDCPLRVAPIGLWVALRSNCAYTGAAVLCFKSKCASVQQCYTQPHRVS
jgi:hypothetical protein